MVLDDGEDGGWPNVVEGDVDRVIFEGPTAQLRVDVGGRELRVDVGGSRRLSVGEGAGRIRLGFDDLTIVPAETEAVTGSGRDGDRATTPRRSPRRASGRSSGASSSASCRRSSTGRTSSSRWPTSGRASRPAGRAAPRRGPPRRHARAGGAGRAGARAAAGGGDRRAGRRPGARRREVLRLDAPPAALPGPDGDDGQRAVRPPVRAARRGPRPLPRLGGPGGRLHRLRRDRDRRRRTSIGAASATSSATTRPAATGSWPTGWAGPRRAGRTTRAWSTTRATVMDAVVDALDEIRDGTEAGIRALVLAHRWGGTTFHDSGWNPRHIEGVEHFLFYNLERITGRHFIHGQPVGLGIVAGSVLQDNEPERMAAALARGRRRHPARGDGRDLGRRRRGAADARRRTSARRACGSRWPTSCRSTDEHVARIRETRRADLWQRGHGMKIGLTLPQGCDREYLGVDAATAWQRTVEVARWAEDTGLRVALGLRPHAGRPAAGGGADLRAVRRARGARRGDAPGAPRPPRPRGRPTATPG